MNLKTFINIVKYEMMVNLLSKSLNILFKLISFVYKCKCINFPKEKCIFAFWHAHQCAAFACKTKRRVCIMVSNSKDGEFISRAANAVGVETIRGSHQRGGTKATLEMIKKIKNEDLNGAITVDGPRGPNGVVKKGIIEISKKLVFQ